MSYLAWAIAVTAIVTYSLRALPLVALRDEIRSPWLESFFYYVPWAVLTAMVIPAVFTSTSSPISAAIGLMGAIILALARRSLITVSLGAAVLVWCAELLMSLV
ncbi:MAG: AzlD domain-containing protein [Actinomycetaceae bacterium]|nr:AzlD domain-containing protein [Actinomycetaceae bacterium]MDY5854532.1 AzlD domain-containing protein [Arcanobacterium sp.]